MKWLIAVLILILPTSAFALTADERHSINYDSVWYRPGSIDSACTPSGGDLTGTGGSLPASVPQPYNALFTKAAAAENGLPALVAAIFYAGEHASHWPNPNGPWATSNKGANGPFQFIPPTWAAYGVDGNGDGKKDVQNLEDAAYGAAHYLSANGGKPGAAEAQIRSAIFNYNHDPGYVKVVFNAFVSFSSGGTAIPATVSADGSSGCGGLGVAGNLTFPLKTTKAVIKAGSDFGGSHYVWCYQKLTNCHHDYNAADLHAPTGTTVVAAVGGTVVSVNSGPQRIRIKGTDGRWYYYTHLLAGSATVRVGDNVNAGQAIGQIGTGQDAENTGPHLHFDISPVENGFARPGPLASQYLEDPQPVLVPAFNNLPE